MGNTLLTTSTEIGGCVDAINENLKDIADAIVELTKAKAEEGVRQGDLLGQLRNALKPVPAGLHEDILLLALSKMSAGYGGGKKKQKKDRVSSEYGSFGGRF